MRLRSTCGVFVLGVAGFDISKNFLVLIFGYIGICPYMVIFVV